MEQLHLSSFFLLREDDIIKNKIEMKKFRELIQKKFDLMQDTGQLFRVDISGDELYRIYLSSFEDDPIFRDPSSSVHNCNHCNNFIRRYGNVVAIDVNGNIQSLFGLDGVDEEYRNTAIELDNAIKQSKIANVFFETFDELKSLPYGQCSKNQSVYQLGIVSNLKRYTMEEAMKFGVVKKDEIREFNHLSAKLSSVFVNATGLSIEAIMASYRDKKNVFQRCMEEISMDTFRLVKDLINQGSLLDGTAHLHAIEKAIAFKADWDALVYYHDEWLWKTTYTMPDSQAKFRNTLMGVLCVELSQGEDINKACENWNKRVDPVNYHKVKSPITEAQKREAEKFVVDNGYLESFDRRLANVDDINVSEIKHISNDTKIKPVTVFDKIKPASSSQHKRAQFDNVETVEIEKFMKDILPSCTSIEALLLNQHEGNLVTLTTSKNKESKPIFKWDNNFSYTFNGNLAGKSMIKEAVKAKGGKVDGVLRFSIMWAENDASDNSDLDAWCLQPNRYSIGFSSSNDYSTGGNLDVDITNPNHQGNKDIVENITWPQLSSMPNGKYVFWVNQFSNRGSKGFQAEIEFNGEVYNYSYNKSVNGNVMVAEVTLNNGVFTIEHKLPSTSVSKELWGLQTEQFHRVNLLCLSPNHWGENAVGNKYFMFMLDGCKTDNSVRGFHNENLIPELLTHRKVMDVLGASSMIDPSSKQLSGIGFNSTVRDELIVRLSGSHKRVVKIKF